MGRIQRDMYNSLEWLKIPYDSKEAITALIVLRADNDVPFSGGEYIAGEDVYLYNDTIREIYLDLDNMIKDTKLSYKQKYIIDRLAIGYTLSDIAKDFNTQKQEILNIVKSAAKKIQKTYHVKLVNWLETSGRVRVSPDAKYKTCKICGQTMNVAYFTPSAVHAEGYRPECKICRM